MWASCKSVHTHTSVHHAPPKEGCKLVKATSKALSSTTVVIPLGDHFALMFDIPADMHRYDKVNTHKHYYNVNKPS